MSGTALVRSSTSGSLISPAGQQKRPATPTATSTTTLPKLQLTPQQTPAPLAQTSTSNTKQTPTLKPQPSPASSTPGRWRHPRMDEVIRRQSRTNFDNNNTKAIIYNLLFLALSFLAASAQADYFPSHFQKVARPYTFYIHLLLRTLFTANIGLALVPLFRKQDRCEDIPLTPHQRQLLGLPPMSRPATPQEKAQYMTPPRYSRSATPGSGNSSLFVQTSGSPLSGRGSPLGSAPNSPFGGILQNQRPGSASPFVPSPLGGGGGGLRGNSGAERRRLSYTSTRSSPLSASDFDIGGAGNGSGGANSINTPSKGHRASVGLNSKWLYEKGRASPNTWGTGSVFS